MYQIVSNTTCLYIQDYLFLHQTVVFISEFYVWQQEITSFKYQGIIGNFIAMHFNGSHY